MACGQQFSEIDDLFPTLIRHEAEIALKLHPAGSASSHWISRGHFSFLQLWSQPSSAPSPVSQPQQFPYELAAMELTANTGCRCEGFLWDRPVLLEPAAHLLQKNWLMEQAKDGSLYGKTPPREPRHKNQGWLRAQD